MSGDAPQQPEKPTQDKIPDISSIAGTIKDKLKGLNFFPALSKAWDKAHESQKSGWMDKIGIFFSTFWKEMKDVKDEKTEVTEDTKRELAKGVTDTIADAQKAAALDDKKVDAPDKEFYDETMAMAVSSQKELDESRQADSLTALDTLEKVLSGSEVEPLTLNQNLALSGVGLKTLCKLKAKFSTPSQFKEALDRLDKISDNSKFPLKKLLSMSVLKIFKLKINKVSEGVDAVASIFGAAESPTMKLLDSFELPIDDAMKLKALKTSPIEDEPQVVTIMHKAFFPHTSEDKVKNVAHIINKLLVEKPDHLDTQIITDLAFNVEDADWSRMIEILTGKKAKDAAESSELPKAA